MNNFTLCPSDAARYLKKLGLDLSRFPKQMRIAYSAALNRAGTTVNNRAAAMMYGRYAVQRQVAASRLRLKKANKSDLAVTITGRGSAVNLIHFHPQAKVVRKTPKQHKRGGVLVTPKKKRVYIGVTVKVLKGVRRKLVKGGFEGRAMAGSMSGAGSYQIFKRVDVTKKKWSESKSGWVDHTTGETSLNVLRGPSLISLLNQEAKTRELIELAGQTLLKRLEHEAEFRLQRLGVIK